MYRKCATEHSARNQRIFENALLELMGTMPYEEISVTGICRQAGISRRTFYHLFGSKQDALYSLVDHRILDIEGFPTGLPDMGLRFFLYWKSQKAFLDALRLHGLWSVLLERMAGSVLREDYEVWQWLRVEEPENREEILIFNLSGIMGLVFRWYESGFEKSPEQMTALIAQLMKKPLAR